VEVLVAMAISLRRQTSACAAAPAECLFYVAEVFVAMDGSIEKRRTLAQNGIDRSRLRKAGDDPVHLFGRRERLCDDAIACPQREGLPGWRQAVVE
jgi:hypothetical protein